MVDLLDAVSVLVTTVIALWLVFQAIEVARKMRNWQRKGKAHIVVVGK